MWCCCLVVETGSWCWFGAAAWWWKLEADADLVLLPGGGSWKLMLIWCCCLVVESWKLRLICCCCWFPGSLGLCRNCWSVLICWFCWFCCCYLVVEAGSWGWLVLLPCMVGPESWCWYSVTSHEFDWKRQSWCHQKYLWKWLILSSLSILGVELMFKLYK